MVNADLISNMCKNEHSDIQIQSMIRAYTHCYMRRKYDQQHVQKHTKLFTDTNHTIRSTFIYIHFYVLMLTCLCTITCTKHTYK